LAVPRRENIGEGDRAMPFLSVGIGLLTSADLRPG